MCYKSVRSVHYAFCLNRNISGSEKYLSEGLVGMRLSSELQFLNQKVTWMSVGVQEVGSEDKWSHGAS